MAGAGVARLYVSSTVAFARSEYRETQRKLAAVVELKADRGRATDAPEVIAKVIGADPEPIPERDINDAHVLDRWAQDRLPKKTHV